MVSVNRGSGEWRRVEFESEAEGSSKSASPLHNAIRKEICERLKLDAIIKFYLFEIERCLHV